MERRRVSHVGHGAVWRVERAIRELDGGELATCRELLVALLPPERRPRWEQIPPAAPPPAARLATEPRAVHGVCVSPPRGAQPKPPPRFHNPQLVRLYRLTHPVCAVRGCGRLAVAHHIAARGRHGDDVWWNLLPLCGKPYVWTDSHHDAFSQVGWHNTLRFPTPHRWLAAFRDQLAPRHVAKVTWALRMAA
jgi:hypothetical protein